MRDFEYRVSTVYAPYFVYGDSSALDEHEINWCDAFDVFVQREHGAGHWDFYDMEPDYNLCDISNTMGDCVACRWTVLDGLTGDNNGL